MLFGCVTSGPVAQWVRPCKLNETDLSNYWRNHFIILQFKVGRKLTAIIGVCGSLAGGYALIAGAQFVWMLLLGRFLHGVGELAHKLSYPKTLYVQYFILGLGCSITISTIYIAEITTPEMRGTMAIVPAVAGTLGKLKNVLF